MSETYPLVFIPGLMCDARLFAPQIHAFSAHTAVQVAAITAYDNVEDLAAHVLQQAPREFALAGLSMGGIVAMEVLRQAPERVAKLALLDTNPKAETAEVSAGREPQIARVEAGELDAVIADIAPHYLAEGLPEAQRQHILSTCQIMAQSLGAEVFVRQSRALQRRPDQQATLKNVQVPTLILCGEQDRLCPLHRHELMHTLIPHSHLQVVANAGHLPTLEQAAVTTAALQAWLNAEV